METTEKVSSPLLRQPGERMLRRVRRVTFALGLFVLAGSSLSLQAAAPQANASQTPSDPQAMEQRADLHMARKEYPEAASLYRRLTQLQPNNAAYQNKLGIAYHLLQNMGEARRAYRRAIQINPRYGQAINNLASIEYAQKNYRAAILSYLKALELTPNDAVIYSNLGTAYFAYEEYDYAMTSYRYALLLDPNVFQDSSRMGTMVQQRTSENLGAFNFYLAKTYAEMGKVEETLLYLQKAWEEGFPDIRKELQDEVFAFLAEEPRFVEFLTMMDAAEGTRAN